MKISNELRVRRTNMLIMAINLFANTRSKVIATSLQEMLILEELPMSLIARLSIEGEETSFVLIDDTGEVNVEGITNLMLNSEAFPEGVTVEIDSAVALEAVERKFDLNLVTEQTMEIPALDYYRFIFDALREMSIIIAAETFKNVSQMLKYNNNVTKLLSQPAALVYITLKTTVAGDALSIKYTAKLI